MKGPNERFFYRQEILNLDFTTQDIIILIASAVVGVWYFLKKHWVANNLFGLAFAINGVELLHLNKVLTGCILLGGLFFYDIFWVFGTNVMVTVAKSFEAPIKLVFPQDLLENGLAAQVKMPKNKHEIQDKCIGKNPHEENSKIWQNLKSRVFPQTPSLS